jgi:hypothetical protein
MLTIHNYICAHKNETNISKKTVNHLIINTMKTFKSSLIIKKIAVTEVAKVKCTTNQVVINAIYRDGFDYTI